METTEVYRSRAPLRLGLGGGGTDVLEYSKQYGGEVFNATINLYCHCTLKITQNKKVIFESRDQGAIQEYDTAAYIKPDGKLDLYKAIYNRIAHIAGKNDMSFHLITYSDVPSGSGLGGSSTMVVSIISAMLEWLRIPFGEYELAELAYQIEREDCGIIGGKQDQFSAAFGGFNYLEFSPNGATIVNPLRIKKETKLEFEASILLFFSGIQRSASIIEDEKRNAIDNCADAIEAMHQVKRDAKKLKEFFLLGDVKGFANALHDSWNAKKKMAKSVTNSEINSLFEIAYDNHAISGKVSGAGGGGFVFFIVDPAEKFNLATALRKLNGKVMSFTFEDEGVLSWKQLS